MKVSPYIWLALLLTSCFTVSTGLELRALRSSNRPPSGDLLQKILGDGRRMFANELLETADVYFHSGFYPTIFEREDKPKNAVATTSHDAPGEDEHEGHDHEGHSEHEKEMNFLGEPRDWIERFGRNFRITEHTELSGAKTREILPWLRMAAEMDPQLVQVYTEGAFVLRKELGDPKEAKAFLREGLRNNPQSYEILFELGRLYREFDHDIERARNIWMLALQRWSAQTPEAKTASTNLLGRITVNLGSLEADAGNWQPAIRYLEIAKTVSPQPDALQKRIDEIKAKNSGK